MRIIGGRDYYDSAMAYGRDDKVVFVRKGREMPDEAVPFLVHRPPFNMWLRKGKKGRIRMGMEGYDGGYRCSPVSGRLWQLDGVTLVFCGVLYRGIRLLDTIGSTGTKRFFWTPDDFEGWLNKEDIVLTWNWNRRDAPLPAIVGRQPPLLPEQLDWVVRNGVVTALAVAERWKVEWAINSDDLKAVEFYRVVDPWTAWQEISMFVGGVLPAHGNEMVEIDDKTRLEKHGFDKVRSFRNMERVTQP